MSRNEKRLPINYERVSIGLQARLAAKEGIAVVDNDPFSRNYDPDDTLTLGKLLPRFKAERYAVAAPIIDMIVDKAISKPATEGLVDALTQAKAVVYTKLQRAGKDNPMRSVYNRFMHLEWFGNTYYLLNEFDFNELENGIGTAARVVSTALYVIPKLHPGKIKPEEFRQTADNSYPLIAQIAALHLGAFFNIADFDESILELVQAGEGYRLGLTAKAKKSLHNKPSKDERFRNRFKYDKITHGCPAIVSIEGPTPVKKLWDFAIEEALAFRISNA